jgi:hypothetical protein
MSEQQTATRWTRKRWDEYLDQVRDTMVVPDLDIRSRARTVLPTVTYVCPFCLHMQSGMDIVQPEGSAEFTATWRDCGHSVAVEA